VQISVFFGKAKAILHRWSLWFQVLFVQAWRRLVTYRRRSTLTLLGITIGVLAMVGVLSFVDALEKGFSEQFSRLGNNTIYVHKWPWKDNSEDWFRYVQRPHVSYEEFRFLSHKLPHLNQISFEATKPNVTVKSELGTLENVTLNGIDGDFFSLYQLELLCGRFFRKQESQFGAYVCILGHYTASHLFREPCQALKKRIRIQNKVFTVIGVTKPQGVNVFGNQLDDHIFIPYHNLKKWVPITKRDPDRLITIQVTDRKFLDMVEQLVIQYMRQLRKLRPSEELNFSINKQEALLEELDRLMDIIRMGGVLISIFALFVGGFGIANIMYVVVRERTREIGIERALGATRRWILLSFLMESGLLATIGGMVGFLILGILAFLTKLITSKMGINFPIQIGIEELFLCLGLSFFVGVIAGIGPARRASQLEPAEAIRFIG